MKSQDVQKIHLRIYFSFFSTFDEYRYSIDFNHIHKQCYKVIFQLPLNKPRLMYVVKVDHQKRQCTIAVPIKQNRNPLWVEKQLQLFARKV